MSFNNLEIRRCYKKNMLINAIVDYLEDTTMEEI